MPTLLKVQTRNKHASINVSGFVIQKCIIIYSNFE